MLEITIKEDEIFDEKHNKFYKIPETTIQLEHSLISLKKWESRWHKPFLAKKDKTLEEIIDYVRCMTISSKKVDPIVYMFLPNSELQRVAEYIQNPMSATYFSDNKSWMVGNGPRVSEEVTAEIIYYWMITLNIPVEFQKWHLEQLLTLIKVVSIKNQPRKKMSRNAEAIQRAQLNAERRAKYNTKG